MTLNLYRELKLLLQIKEQLFERSLKCRSKTAVHFALVIFVRFAFNVNPN